MPLVAGADARVLSSAARAVSSGSVATNATRMPLEPITNVCDSRRSPSTVATAETEVPLRNPDTVARPVASVFTTRFAPSMVNSTGWFGTSLSNPPRMTRTVTVPTGTSVAGSGCPDISLGLGICTWAERPATASITITKYRPRP